MMSYIKNVRRVTPYVPGEQPSRMQDVIKLNTNENPYPPAPAVERVLRNYGDRVHELAKYPDPTCKDLREAIAKEYNVDAGQVFVGVGSDDVLAMSFLTFFNSDKPVIFPDITYSFYDVWCDLFRIPYETIPLDDEFLLHAADYKRDCGGIVIANPNAPTGRELDMEAMEEIISYMDDRVVIIDEAYADFGNVTALSLLDKYDNLLIVRTMSKSRSLAGSRIGYAIGSKEMIKFLDDVKYSYNSYTMDRITLEIGVAAMSDRAYFDETVAKIKATRERLRKELISLGFKVYHSDTNFLFARPADADAKGLFERLRNEGIYVRHFDKPRINEWLRISVGTDAECDRLIAFLKGL